MRSQKQTQKTMSQELHHHFQLAGELGRGRFGTVYLCHRRSNAADAFACKTIDKRRLLSSTDPLDLHCLRREADVMSHLASSSSAAAARHLLRLHDSFEDDHSLHLILDLCPSPDLLCRLPLPEQDAAAVMRQLMGAVAACHRLGVAHRDIKPDNILFDARGRLKLADFGSAEFFGGGRPAMSGVVGTPYYVAPEVLAGGEYDEKVDVWSAGVVLYVMLAGVAPFDGETAAGIFEAVMRGNLRFPTKIFHSVSPLAKDLMRRMMCRDVSRRLSADQVLRHPWMTSLEESNSVVDLTCPSHPVAAC